MVDWVGNDGRTTAERYRFMAVQQLDTSPTYRRLCDGVADDAEVVGLLDDLRPAKRQPNLLLAAARYLDAPIDDYPAFRSFVVGRWDELSSVMLARATQTNEAARCATMLPALAAIDGPIALVEVGASAGLCLQPDRYAYRYDGGPVLGSSPVVLDCTTRGTVPFPERLPQIVWRAGLDLNPLDVTDADTVRWLECLVWPEHAARFATLRGAVSIARRDPPRVARGDLTTDLTALVRKAPADATLVVVHSAVLAYLDGDGRDAFRSQLELVARTRPTVWLSNEGPGVVVDVDVPAGPVPFVLARHGEPLALTDPHGAWVSWL